MQAYSCYLEAVRIQPTFAIAWSNLAGLFMESGDLNRALQYYKEAVKLKPAFPDAYFNLGNVYKVRLYSLKVELQQCFSIKYKETQVSFNLCFIRLWGDLQRQSCVISMPYRRGQVLQWHLVSLF